MDVDTSSEPRGLKHLRDIDMAAVGPRGLKHLRDIDMAAVGPRGLKHLRDIDMTAVGEVHGGSTLSGENIQIGTHN